MPLQIPDIAAVDCTELNVCGHVETRDKSAKKWLKGRSGQWRVAKMRSSNGTLFVRTRMGAPFKEHVHIEIVQRGEFDTAPSVDASIKELKEEFAPLVGQTVYTDVEATFLVPKKRLPPFVLHRMVNVQQGSITIKSCGGKLAVEGGPLYMITWCLRSESEAGIRLESRLKTTIKDDYVQEIMSVMASMIEALKAGEQSNDHRP